MNKVIVNRSNKWEAIDLEEFKKDYGITPKHTGEYFYTIGKDGRDYMIYKFPNPACMFVNGEIQYIIYKGNVQTIVNGVRMPNFDPVPENGAFDSQEDAMQCIYDIEEKERGTGWIDTKDGRRIPYEGKFTTD